MTSLPDRQSCDSTSECRRRIGRSLMTAVVLCGMANVSGQDLSNHSWHSLEKQAGYFTESGQWRGGFPKSEHKTGHIFQICSTEHSSGKFCQTWTREGESAETTGRGTCDCQASTDTESYCTKWNCAGEETETRCRSERGKTCRYPRKSQGVQNCTCLKAAANEAYCQSWACTMDMIRKKAVQGEYKCIDDSPSTYCEQWIGHISSDKEEISQLFRCGQEGNGYCRYGNCETRSILRCSKHKGGWCNLSLSLFFGGCGVALLIGGTMIIFSDSFVEDVEGKTLAAILVAHICLFVFPWGVGVASSGGVKGIQWVVVMWSAFIILAIAYAYWKLKGSQKPAFKGCLRWIGTVLGIICPCCERERHTSSKNEANPQQSESSHLIRERDEETAEFL